MEQTVASLLRSFEEGKMNRRQLIQSLAVAASAASIVGSVPGSAAEGSAIKVTKVDHISYQVANYAKTRDFYSALLGMKVSADDGKTRCSLSVGDMVVNVHGPQEPLHEVGGSKIPVRAPHIGHLDYSTDLSQDAILAELVRRGLKSEPAVERGYRIKDPDGFDLVLRPKK